MPYLFKEKLLTRFEHVWVYNWVKTTILYMVTARAAAFGGANWPYIWSDQTEVGIFNLYSCILLPNKIVSLLNV